MKKKLGIFVIVIVILYGVFSCFFEYHLVSDAYRIIDKSNEYMINLKLIEGRPIQALYFKVLSILGIGIDSVSRYLFLYRINLAISIIILSISFCIVYNAFFKSLNLKNKKQKLLLFIITLTIFVNISICEYMLFIENFIMSLGLLLSIIAALVFYSNNKFKYSITFILLLISSLCYQGVTQLFVVFDFILFLLQNNVNIKNYNKKEYIYVVLRILFLYMGAQILNYSLCVYCNSILPQMDPRLFTGIIENLKRIVSYTNVNILRIYIIIFVTIVLINIKILSDGNIKKHLINMVILVILSIISFFIFLFNNSCALMPRTTLNFIVIYPILEIYIITLKKNRKYNLDFIFISLLLIFNIVSVIKVQKLNIDSTNQNITVVQNIIEKIEEYEIENNVKIENVAFYTDLKLNYKYWNAAFNVYSTYTNPIYYGYWCDIYSINVLSDRKFNRIEDGKRDKNMYDYFKSKNWDEPNLDEQMLFNENTVSICRF